MIALIVVLSVLSGACALALFGLWELRRKRVEDLARLTGERTAEEILRRLKP